MEAIPLIQQEASLLVSAQMTDIAGLILAMIESIIVLQEDSANGKKSFVSQIVIATISLAIENISVHQIHSGVDHE